MTWEILSIAVEGRDRDDISFGDGWEPFAVDRGVLYVRRLLPEEEPPQVLLSIAFCEVCGTQIESDEWLELGQLRFRKNLCRRHFESMRDRR